MRPKLVVLTDLLPDQVASMAGSALAGRLLAPSAGNIRVERYMQTVFAVSAVALFVPVIFNRTQALEADSLNADAPGDCRAQRLVLSISEFQWQSRDPLPTVYHNKTLQPFETFLGMATEGRTQNVLKSVCRP